LLPAIQPFLPFSNLGELNATGIKFITLRRRGKKLVEKAEYLTGWQLINVNNTRRKYPNPQIHESSI
jgi:hypothetical protein